MAARAQAETATVKKSTKTAKTTSAKANERSKSTVKAASRTTPSTAEPAEDISAGSSVVGTNSPPPKATEKVKLDITAKKAKSSKKTKSSDAKSSDAKSSDAKSSDAKSSNAKSSDAKSSDAKSSDAKSSDAKTSDAKSTEEKSQEDKTSADKSDKPTTTRNANASAKNAAAPDKSATASDKIAGAAAASETTVNKKGRDRNASDDHSAGIKKKAEPLKSKQAAKRRKVDEDSPPAAVEVARDETPDADVDDVSSGTATPFNLLDVVVGIHNESGTTKSLSEWMSAWDAKTLVFVVYPKASTPGCTKQCVAFSKLSVPSHVKLVGLSLDSETSQASFDKKNSLNFPLVCSGAKELLSPLKCLSSDGKIIRSVVAISNEGSVIYEKHKVSPESSSNDFLEFLQKSQSDLTEDEGATAVDDGSVASEEKQTDQDKPVVEKKSRNTKASSKVKKDDSKSVGADTKSVGAASKAKAKSNKSTSKSAK